MQLKFTTTILLNIQNPYILVSKQRAQNLKTGWKKPMPVFMQIKPWRINLIPKGDGNFSLSYWCCPKTSDTKVGDKVTVLLGFDDSYENGPQYILCPRGLVPLFQKTRMQKLHGTRCLQVERKKSFDTSHGSSPPRHANEISRGHF